MADLSFDYEKVHTLVKLALVEDIGNGDITTELTVPADMSGRMRFVSRQSAVIAGLVLVEPIYRELSRQVQCELMVAEGDTVGRGQVVARVAGPMRALLAGERLALNFLQHLSGVATLTRRFVDAVAGTSADILDTRKTTPGLRYLEKYAVRVGGGVNHRMGLYDQVLIKDNHLACLSGGGRENLSAVVKRLRTHAPDVVIEVEVEDLTQLDEVLKAGVDIVLLDNMSLAQLAQAVDRTDGLAKRPLLEVSGGVTFETVGAIARAGVDRISVGMLTHSVPAVDIAADVEIGDQETPHKEVNR